MTGTVVKERQYCTLNTISTYTDYDARVYDSWTHLGVKKNQGSEWFSSRLAFSKPPNFTGRSSRSIFAAPFLTFAWLMLIYQPFKLLILGEETWEDIMTGATMYYQVNHHIGFVWDSTTPFDPMSIGNGLSTYSRYSGGENCVARHIADVHWGFVIILKSSSTLAALALLHLNAEFITHHCRVQAIHGHRRDLITTNDSLKVSQQVWGCWISDFSIPTRMSSQFVKRMLLHNPFTHSYG